MGHQNKTVSDTEAVFVLRRRREIRTEFGRLAACVTRNQKGFPPPLPTQRGLKSLSYAHISGGSPKQSSLRNGGCFCFMPQARDSNGVRAACRLRNAQSKRLHATFTHSMRFGILILCAYLRWVTKTKQSPDGGCFCLRRRREIRTGFGRLAACVRSHRKYSKFGTPLHIIHVACFEYYS